MKLTDRRVRRTADWLMYGTPTLRSVACVRCERTLGMSEERVADLLREIEEGMELDVVIQVLEVANS